MSVYMNLKLLIVISLALTLSHVVHSVIVRRDEQRTMTDKQKSDIVKHHNLLRAKEGAADMEMMTWNESLAGASKAWAVQCKWYHGFPPLPGTSLTKYGQNLYMIRGPKINMVKAVQAWYDEKSDFDYDTLGCAAGKMCGHYTQVVWAASRQVGCAYHFCTEVRDEKKAITSNDAEVLACDYLPQGNFVGEKPFKKGAACSKCESGAGWCKDKLCNSQCSTAGKDCSCAIHCYNCAKMSLETCRCTCADGWYGPDCRERCEDKSDKCDPKPGKMGYPPDWCDKKHQMSSMVKKECLAMCKLCKPDPDAVAGQCPPEEGPGAYKPTSTASTMLVMIQQVMMLPVVMIVISISSNNAAL